MRVESESNPSPTQVDVRVMPVLFCLGSHMVYEGERIREIPKLECIFQPIVIDNSPGFQKR